MVAAKSVTDEEGIGAWVVVILIYALGVWTFQLQEPINLTLALPQHGREKSCLLP